MLCSSGGNFAKTQGGLEYQGGETRLVSVSNHCHMQELQDALHRVSQTMRLDLSNSCGSVRLVAGCSSCMQSCARDLPPAGNHAVAHMLTVTFVAAFHDLQLPAAIGK